MFTVFPCLKSSQRWRQVPDVVVRNVQVGQASEKAEVVGQAPLEAVMRQAQPVQPNQGTDLVRDGGDPVRPQVHIV